MNILILSQEGDEHTQSVQKALNTLSASHNVVIFERYRKDHFIDFSSRHDFTPRIVVANQSYQLNQETFCGIYWRVKPFYPGELPALKQDNNQFFCANEWKSCLQGAYHLTPHLNWLNHITHSFRTENKLYQLKLAQSCGLTIPETLITNSQSELIDFFDAQGDLIYKPANSCSAMPLAVFTNQITRNHITHSKDRISIAPGIFQKNIQKDHELRVTLVGDTFHVAKIHSQEHEKSKIDWRKGAYTESAFSMGELSDATKAKLLAFHQACGLGYGAYDFIVDTQGQEIFLECNPAGQWLWLEELLPNYEVSKAIAKLLLKPLR